MMTLMMMMMMMTFVTTVQLTCQHESNESKRQVAAEKDESGEDDMCIERLGIWHCDRLILHTTDQYNLSSTSAVLVTTHLRL